MCSEYNHLENKIKHITLKERHAIKSLSEDNAIIIKEAVKNVSESGLRYYYIEKVKISRMGIGKNCI